VAHVRDAHTSLALHPRSRQDCESAGERDARGTANVYLARFKRVREGRRSARLMTGARQSEIRSDKPTNAPPHTKVTARGLKGAVVTVDAAGPPSSPHPLGPQHHHHHHDIANPPSRRLIQARRRATRPSLRIFKSARKKVARPGSAPQVRDWTRGRPGTRLHMSAASARANVRSGLTSSYNTCTKPRVAPHGRGAARACRKPRARETVTGGGAGGRSGRRRAPYRRPFTSVLPCLRACLRACVRACVREQR
jgi:hypothetical protein